LWGIVHVYFMIGFRRRLLVALEWLWSYMTYQRGARLITGNEGGAAPLDRVRSVAG
jgi:NADH dehydrogenase